MVALAADPDAGSAVVGVVVAGQVRCKPKDQVTEVDMSCCCCCYSQRSVAAAAAAAAVAV
jgi:hypothetical protein